MVRTAQGRFHARESQLRRTMEESRLEILSGTGRTAISKLSKMKTLLLRNSREASTQTTYYYYQKKFTEFTKTNRLPWNEETALLFVTRWFCKARSISGCKQAKCAIAALYDDKGNDSLKGSERMERLLKSCKKYGAVPRSKNREPFPVKLLHLLCVRMPEEWTIERWYMVCALIAIGLRTMARGSELGMLNVTDITFGKNSTVTVSFNKTKTKKHGRKVTIKASNRITCPVRLLKQWLSLRTSGYLFGINGRITIDVISKELQTVANLYNVQGYFTSHSLRIGGASALTFAGYSKEKIMAIGDWSSDAIDRYIRETIDHHCNVTEDMLL